MASLTHTLKKKKKSPIGLKGGDLAGPNEIQVLGCTNLIYCKFPLILLKTTSKTSKWGKQKSIEIRTSNGSTNF